MKRKTNLFYTVGSDSNFITFSNYTESLTGSFLSTETKLFPSAFMCLYAEELNDSNRADFIKHICAAYENKLAFLRDKCIEHNYNVEERLHPGDWLLDIIFRYFNNNVKVSYAGQVTEQDYNGSFTDTIMTIDSNVCNKVDVIFNEELPNVLVEKYDASKNYLYGWYITSSDVESYVGPADAASLIPIFDTSIDGEEYYRYEKTINRISVYDDGIKEDIKFNIVIPMYDLVHMKDTDEAFVLNSSQDLGLNSMSAINKVPLGIWFSGNEPVVLNRRNEEYAPSWSLSLSSQFKPFPYSKSEVTNIDQTSKNEAFMTYAQIIVKHNEIIDKMNNINNAILGLNNRIIQLEAKVNNMSTSAEVDLLKTEIANIKTVLKQL